MSSADSNKRPKLDAKANVLMVGTGEYTTGYVGGTAGARQHHPGTHRLKLVLDGNRVITAYPTWPPRRN